MIPPPFDYLAPTTLDEAISFLDEHAEDSKVLAGGHSLIPLMKLRLIRPRYLVDINRISGLEYITEREGFLRIGALTRYVEVEGSELVRSKYSALSDCVSHIGDSQVRNLGTVGGNITHADPSNDIPAVMLAFKASMMVTGKNGVRKIACDDFFVDTFQTALSPSEILTEIQIPAPPASTGSAYMKLERRAGDFPVVGVAVKLTVNSKNECTDVGIGLTAAGPKPLRAKAAEDSLLGKKPEEQEINQAAVTAAQISEPSSDIRGSAEYKKEMVKVMTRRALRSALQRIHGDA